MRKPCAWRSWRAAWRLSGTLPRFPPMLRMTIRTAGFCFPWWGSAQVCQEEAGSLLEECPGDFPEKGGAGGGKGEGGLEDGQVSRQDEGGGERPAPHLQILLPPQEGHGGKDPVVGQAEPQGDGAQQGQPGGEGEGKQGSSRVKEKSQNLGKRGLVYVQPSRSANWETGCCLEQIVNSFGSLEFFQASSLRETRVILVPLSSTGLKLLETVFVFAQAFILQAQVEI